MGHAYGRDFRYDEAQLMGPGRAGWVRATALAMTVGGTIALGLFGPVRRVFSDLMFPPGEGPPDEENREGYFEFLLFGEHPVDRGRSLYARVFGNRDPGYGSTSRMLGETALCLAQDPIRVGGGIWTPASALGERLLMRLQAHAGLSFSIEPDFR